jgi:hypothetical protein
MVRNQPQFRRRRKELHRYRRHAGKKYRGNLLHHGAIILTPGPGGFFPWQGNRLNMRPVIYGNASSPREEWSIGGKRAVKTNKKERQYERKITNIVALCRY